MSAAVTPSVSHAATPTGRSFEVILPLVLPLLALVAWSHSRVSEGGIALVLRFLEEAWRDSPALLVAAGGFSLSLAAGLYLGGGRRTEVLGLWAIGGAAALWCVAQMVLWNRSGRIDYLAHAPHDQRMSIYLGSLSSGLASLSLISALLGTALIGTALAAALHHRRQLTQRVGSRNGLVALAICSPLLAVGVATLAEHSSQWVSALIALVAWLAAALAVPAFRWNSTRRGTAVVLVLAAGAVFLTADAAGSRNRARLLDDETMLAMMAAQHQGAEPAHDEPSLELQREAAPVTWAHGIAAAALLAAVVAWGIAAVREPVQGPARFAGLTVGILIILTAGAVASVARAGVDDNEKAVRRLIADYN